MRSIKDFLKKINYKKDVITDVEKYKRNPIIEAMARPKGYTLEEAERMVWSKKKLGKLKGLSNNAMLKKPSDMNQFYLDLVDFKLGKFGQDYFNIRYQFDPTCNTRFDISLILKRYQFYGFDFRSPKMIYANEEK